MEVVAAGLAAVAAAAAADVAELADEAEVAAVDAAELAAAETGAAAAAVGRVDFSAVDVAGEGFVCEHRVPCDLGLAWKVVELRSSRLT